MKTLYIICGEPSVGKSTTALALTGNEALVFEADKFPKWWETGKYQWSKELASESHQWCKNQLEAAMQKNLHPLALSNNIIESRGWQPYIELGLNYGYNIQIISCDGVVIADGSTPNNVHGLNAGLVLSRRTKKKRYVPESKIFWDKYTQKDDSLPTLYIFDRDNTLVKGEGNTIPSIKTGFMPIESVISKVKQLQQQGDIIAIASNQAGISFNSNGGNPHKTEEELLEECQLLKSWLEPDIQLYCPDIDGKECWEFNESKFIKFNQSKYSWTLPFRKPSGGMLEIIMQRHSGKFGNIIMIGDERKDELAAQSVGAQFVHAWDFSLI